jgi:hypothetical protein
MVRWKEFVRKRPWPSKDTISTLAWKKKGKSKEVSFRRAGVPAGIRTEHHPDINLESYRHTSLLGEGEYKK